VYQIIALLPLNYPQFSERLSNIWCFYEAFLTQTQLLNTKPIRELANTFNNLKVSNPFNWANAMHVG